MRHATVNNPAQRVVWEDPEQFPWDEVFKEDPAPQKSETPFDDWAKAQDAKLIAPLVAPILEMQEQLEATRTQVDALVRHYEGVIQRRSTVFLCWMLFGCVAYIFVVHPVVTGIYANLENAVESIKPDGVEVAPQQSVTLSAPTNAPKSSPIGMRVHPITGENRMHAGLDYAAPMGTPVMAAASGKVSDVGFDSDYGNFIEIDHGNGLKTFYAHLQDGSVLFDVGTPVMKGVAIARVGSTGLSTGPHLHFETILHGEAVDPEELLGGPGIGEQCQ